MHHSNDRKGTQVFNIYTLFSGLFLINTFFSITISHAKVSSRPPEPCAFKDTETSWHDDDKNGPIERVLYDRYPGDEKLAVEFRKGKRKIPNRTEISQGILEIYETNGAQAFLMKSLCDARSFLRFTQEAKEAIMIPNEERADNHSPSPCHGKITVFVLDRFFDEKSGAWRALVTTAQNQNILRLGKPMKTCSSSND